MRHRRTTPHEVYTTSEDTVGETSSEIASTMDAKAAKRDTSVFAAFLLAR
ncbi:hypothetical protein [Ktedonospora formicarum]|uniref:Uncharacterized protein n=1 Tax=Ktedonospora formicarum TaxID=2778364 RepID=A0A8J3IB92_9CHLR|nr:hypothetical protein [Ktedonospora formicarum]GHO49128.1 hypothetical protein KSX_72910 [Ktedonospora formicarum]